MNLLIHPEAHKLDGNVVGNSQPSASMRYRIGRDWRVGGLKKELSWSQLMICGTHGPWYSYTDTGETWHKCQTRQGLKSGRQVLK